MKSLTSLIEEASRLDKELAKMPPEKQMEILNKINQNNLNNYYNRIGKSYLNNPDLHVLNNDFIDRMSDLNYNFQQIQDNLDLNNKQTIADELRVLQRRMFKNIDDKYNTVYNRKFVGRMFTPDFSFSYPVKFTDNIERRQDVLTSPKLDKELNLKDIYGFEPNIKPPKQLEQKKFNDQFTSTTVSQEIQKENKKENKKQARENLKKNSKEKTQRFYYPVALNKKQSKNYSNIGKYIAAGLGGLGAGALGYNLFSDDVSDRIHELLGAL